MWWQEAEQLPFVCSISFPFVRSLAFKIIKLTFLAQFMLGNKICFYRIQHCVCVHVLTCVWRERKRQTAVPELISNTNEDRNLGPKH